MRAPPATAARPLAPSPGASAPRSPASPGLPHPSQSPGCLSHPVCTLRPSVVAAARRRSSAVTSLAPEVESYWCQVLEGVEKPAAKDKGTGAREGGAYAGTQLATLDTRGCRGIFATHHHSLRKVGLDLRGVRWMAMEVGAGKKVGRIVEGESRESLALEVPRNARMSREELVLMAQFFEALPAEGPSWRPGPSPGPAGGAAADGSVPKAVFAAVAAPEQGSNGNGAGAGGSCNDLPSAARILQSTAAHVLANLGASAAGESHPAIHYVPADMKPPARPVGRSCVYIACRADGWLYAGTSDALSPRIKAHRQRNSANSAVADPGAEFAYIIMDPAAQGSATAKAIEAATIEALKGAGVPLLSDADARNRRAHIAR